MIFILRNDECLPDRCFARDLKLNFGSSFGGEGGKRGSLCLFGK